MTYFRDSTHKYPGKGKHAWRLNDNGTVDFRDETDNHWRAAELLINSEHLYDEVLAGNLEVAPGDPWGYDCRNDN